MLFFLFVITLFPLFLTPSDALLKTLAPAIIWFAALLSQVLSLPKIFQEEKHDGCLQLYCLSPQPLAWLICLKVVVHIIFHLLPLLFLSPLIMLLYKVSFDEWLILMSSMALGLLILQMLGTCISALLINTRQASLLLIVLVLPLYIPIILFATTLLHAYQQSMNIAGPYSFLIAITCIVWAILPCISAQALRIGIES